MAVNYRLAGAPQYALTGGPWVYQVFTPASQADLVERICNALLAAYHPGGQPYGWSYDSDVAISGSVSGGHRLRVVSPQGFECYLTVQWGPGSFGRNPVGLSFSSSTGSGAVGFQAILDYQDNRPYQVVANPTGLCVSRPGVLGDKSGSSVCAGIPWVDTGCGFGTEPITEIWYSFGDWLGGFASFSFTGFNPRVGLGLGPAGYLGGSQQGNYNGTLTGPGTRDKIGHAQVLYVAGGGQGDVFQYDHPVWIDGVPILYPAFVAWGNDIDSGIRVRGQMYDAICRSKAYAVDSTASFDGYDWIAYTGVNPAERRYEAGSLWLLTGSTTGDTSLPIVNVAY